MLKLSVHPDVENKDIQGIFDYIAQDDLEAADRVTDGIIDTFELLAQHPGLGKRYPLKHPKLQEIHQHTAVKIPGPSYRNYLIFYRPDDDQIRILYVFRCSLDIPEQMADDLRK